MEKAKPAVFIASSTEGFRVAEAINLLLDRDTVPTLWRTNTFKLGSSVIDDLVKKSSAVDFAVFVFTPDDVAIIRDETTRTVRDNVLFELGLFIGALGKERCYVVRPRGIDMHLPSDLLGVVHADYAADRPDGEIVSALNAACRLIKDEIARHGSIPRQNIVGPVGRHIANPPEYSLNGTDLLFLGECAASHISHPRGFSFHRIADELRGHSTNALRISATKLVRLGYVDKTIEVDDHDGEEYYCYSITENGLDIYLKNEATYSAASPSPRQRGTPSFADMGDDIPF